MRIAKVPTRPWYKICVTAIAEDATVKIFTSYCSKQWLRLIAMRAWDHAINNQPNLYCHTVREQVTIAKARSAHDEIHRSNNNIVEVQWSIFNIVLQEVTASKTFLSSHREQQQQLIAMSAWDHAYDNHPFSLMWINHIDNCKGAKHQQ